MLPHSPARSKTQSNLILSESRSALAKRLIRRVPRILVAKKRGGIRDRRMRLRVCVVLPILAFPAFLAPAQTPKYNIDDVIRIARAQNPEIAIAQKKEQAARGSL